MEPVELDSLLPVYGGMCLCRKEGVIFLKGAIPGERVLAHLLEKKRDYSTYQIVEILDESKDRVKPKCPVFGSCGGCHYQHISYDRQIAIKKEILVDCLLRIAKLNFPVIDVISKNQWYYRAKAQFKVSAAGNTNKIGFYQENTRNIISIDRCFIVSDSINSYLTRLKEMFKELSGVKEIDVLSAKNSLACIYGDKNGSDLASVLTEAGFDGVVFSNGKFVGQNNCVFDMDISGIGSFVYTISPQGFFQSNWEVNKMLIEDIIKTLANELDGKNVLDVYGGAGNFALPISRLASSVTVVEENPFCVMDGKNNVKLNDVRNVKFIKKSFEKAKIDGKYDIVIVDPPRRGLTNEAINKLLILVPEKIVYVSCNPATFCRDLKKLSVEHYELQSIKLVDMFPNTYHLEIIGVLEKK